MNTIIKRLGEDFDNDDLLEGVEKIEFSQSIMESYQLDLMEFEKEYLKFSFSSKENIEQRSKEINKIEKQYLTLKYRNIYIKKKFEKSKLFKFISI